MEGFETPCEGLFERGSFEEIEMYLKKANEEVFIAVNSALQHYNESESQVQDQTIQSKPDKPLSRNTKDFVTKENYSLDNRRKVFHNNSLPRTRLRPYYNRWSNIHYPSNLGPNLRDWSDNLLKDFNNIVEEEIKSLSDTCPSFNNNYLIENDTPENGITDRKTFRETVDHLFEESDMGANQTSLRLPDSLIDSYYEASTLPRSSHRSISLVGERLAVREPFNRNETCRLLSIKHHRFSRSLSLDEGAGVSPWALEQLQLIEGSHDVQNQEDSANFPDNVHKNIRKYGLSRKDNEDVVQEEFVERCLKRRSNSLSNHDLFFLRDSDFSKNEPQLDVFPNRHHPKALTEDALNTSDSGSLLYVDDESLFIKNQSNISDSQIPNTSKDNGHPNTLLETEIDNVIGAEFPKITPKDMSILLNPSNTLELKEISGRKSEPAYPSSKMSPSLRTLGSGGQEARRNTVPGQNNCLNENGLRKSQDTIVFSTSTVSTLLPAEEMVVMENKSLEDFQTSSNNRKINQNGRKQSADSVYSSSSLSSLSRLSLREEFSENEDEIHSCEDQNENLSPDIFDTTDHKNLKRDFTPEIKESESSLRQRVNIDSLTPRLNEINSNNSKRVKVTSLDNPQLDESTNLKNVFVDTKPIIIKLTPKLIQNESIDTTDSNIFHKTQISLLNRFESHDSNWKLEEKSDLNTENKGSDSSEPITGILQITQLPQFKDNELIFSVTLPNKESEENLDSPRSSDRLTAHENRKNKADHSLDAIDEVNHNGHRNDSYSADDYTQKFKEVNINHSKYGNDSFLETSQNISQNEARKQLHLNLKSVNNLRITDLEANKQCKLVQHWTDTSVNNVESRRGPNLVQEWTQNCQKHPNVSKKERRKIKSRSFHAKERDVDSNIFLQKVRKRIASPGMRSSSSLDRGLSEKSMSPLLFPFDPPPPPPPQLVFDACTQTSCHPSPASGSPTLSFTWMSDFGCDAASLEPCASSMGTEDLGGANEDWWASEGSLSSSPPETPASPTRDDSSLSLSESLDNLDNNAESGIGTVSTRPSLSPMVNTGSQDCSGSNLSSEDTGLETSFERRGRKYLQNSRVSKPGDHSIYYRRKRPRGRHPDFWIRKENQMTQTDPQFPSSPFSDEGNRQRRASSEESTSQAWDVRQTHSEPRLTKTSNPNLGMRFVTSETALPAPNFNPSRSFCLQPPLPTVSEGLCPSKYPYERPRNLSLGQVHVPSKASSAPLLKMGLHYRRDRVDLTPSDDSPSEPPGISIRTQSAKELSEIEALEGCKWLRAAGFPQYAQMYEDFQFPLDLSSVERDHLFLDRDSLQALFRRLRILNRCAKIRLDPTKLPDPDESEDEEQQCALSAYWAFEGDSKRWSRIDPNDLRINRNSQEGMRAVLPEDSSRVSDSPDDLTSGHFKRSGSERLKSGAKAFLRRMESLKSKKQRRQKPSVVISSPKVLDEDFMKDRIKELGCVDVSPEVPQKTLVGGVPRGPASRKESSLYSNRSRGIISGEDSSSLASDQSQQSLGSSPRFRSRRRKKFWKRGFTIGEWGHGGGGGSGGAFSDSEYSPPTWRHRMMDDNFNINPFSDNRSSPSPDDLLDRRKTSLRHSSSLNYGHEGQTLRPNFFSGVTGERLVHPVFEGETKTETTLVRREKSCDREVLRHSIYDNVPLVICNQTYHDYQSEGTDIDMITQEGSGSSECTMGSRESPLMISQDDEAEGKSIDRRITVDRWHSFNRKSSSLSAYGHIGTQIAGFSVGQMNHLRKRALLKLTALMEKFCPSNRSNWNWELPRFIRKIKSPDYKSRLVFGVPLQVTNQRTGYPLPEGIQEAFAYLKANCMDQIGIFRKPGVKSRIQNLRQLHEAAEDISYADFGPYDIADVVKTYFRELPEVLLTNKLSEIFIAIFQYLPMEVRTEALQCVMLMLPDENRETLMHLLGFLSDVAENSSLNQMTASNLAVCMAPSLFQLNVGNSSTSPLRRKVPGSPEQKDLHDNKAAHQCLTLMIEQVSRLQSVPVEMINSCRFSYLDLSLPVALEDLGLPSSTNAVYPYQDGDWNAYMNACIQSLLKESREKSRGWVSLSHPDPLVEVAYRKVGDGHPLRLWRITTEVEAPPTELLNRVLRERHFWDESLLKWRVVAKLSKSAEVFQYMCNSMPPRPPVDFCVLRSWRSNLGKGLCVVVETSVEHGDAPLLGGSVRGIILASRYMIQPCGSGKSRITHISRVDMKGRLPEWYNKNYPYLVANHVTKLRLSFQHFALGPESKV